MCIEQTDLRKQSRPGSDVICDVCSGPLLFVTRQELPTIIRMDRCAQVVQHPKSGQGLYHLPHIQHLLDTSA